MTSSRRRRRPVLPALSAALIGALTAGATTFMSDTQLVTDAGQVTLAVENPGVPQAAEQGSETAPDPVERSSDRPTQDAPTSTGTPPATTTDAPPPSTSRTAESSATPPPTPPTRPQVTEEEQVVALVNAARAQSGCEPLRVVPELGDAAAGHSEDMSARDYFDHTTPEGVGFAERIVDAGYPSPGAENIARGQTSATQVMNSWMESDGHRANILNCQLRTIGVGLDKDGWYWTQNFGY